MAKTSITVEDSTLERFKNLKAELDDVQDAPDHTADSFLNALLDTWERDNGGTAIYQPGSGVPVDVIREELDTDAPDYDDVKAACEAAIEAKLGERV